MEYIYDYLCAFLVGGTICFIGQLIMDKWKLLPIHVTVLFVVLGSFLEMFNLYDYLIEYGRAGALVPISSFGHSLTHSAVMKANEIGFFGIILGMFEMTSSGICSAILFAFFTALIFKPRG